MSSWPNKSKVYEELSAVLKNGSSVTYLIRPNISYEDRDALFKTAASLGLYYDLYTGSHVIVSTVLAKK